MSKLSDTMFFRLGAMKFSESFDGLAKLTDVCTYDATLYSDNSAKYCMIRPDTSFRPHLVRHLNLLEQDQREYIQIMWDQSNRYIDNLKLTPYQCFLVITSNRYSVPDHTHGDHLGDTITVVSTVGTSPSNTYLCLEDGTRLKYPDPNEGNFAVCFDSNSLHRMESRDDNFYFHFVYDLVNKCDCEKNMLRKIL